MPTIETKYFGTVEYGDESCFEFPFGLPAFEDERQFLPLEMPGYHPLLFLQSTKTPALCFVALPVLVSEPGYELAMSREDRDALGFDIARQPEIGPEALVLTLLSIRENAPATANLMAPVVINVATRRSMQAIREDRSYSHQHVLRMEECAC